MKRQIKIVGVIFAIVLFAFIFIGLNLNICNNTTIEDTDKYTVTDEFVTPTPTAGVSAIITPTAGVSAIITPTPTITESIIYEEVDEEIKEEYTMMYVTSDIVNVRIFPSIESELIDEVYKGDAIAIYGYEGDWAYTVSPDTGDVTYIFGEFLSEEEPQKYEFTDDELDLLAHLIYSENGTEGYLCMLYTGSVVLNRIDSEYFPDNMYDVIYQKGQYAVTWGAKTINKEPSEDAYDIAHRLLTYGSALPSNVVFQAEFYQGDGTYAEVGKTKFCYINN